jgi:hypothetical protein
LGSVALGELEQGGKLAQSHLIQSPFSKKRALLEETCMREDTTQQAHTTSSIPQPPASGKIYLTPKFSH